MRKLLSFFRKKRRKRRLEDLSRRELLKIVKVYRRKRKRHKPYERKFKPEPRECALCGGVYTPLTHGVFCSRLCRGRHRRLKWSVAKIKNKCSVCGKIFILGQKQRAAEAFCGGLCKKKFFEAKNAKA